MGLLRLFTVLLVTLILSILLRLYCTSGPIFCLFFQAHLWINVIDTNDHSPNFTEAIYNFEVSEAADPGMVGHVSATDDDIRENGRVTYKITSGDGMGVFDIDAEV